jgi:dTDP-4-amino-4,6-dideoxygalactose transaminase
MPDRRWLEIPPTAGLPLRASDFLPATPPLASQAATFLGVPHVGLACSGTACLVTILSAMHALQPGRDTVIVPAYSCPLVVLAIAHCGLHTKLCDLQENGFDFDPAMLAASCNERTLAVLPTHLGGRVADVGLAARIARRHGAYVIEDAAQAFGARMPEACVGLTGDAGFFSLAVGKGLTLYEGGIWISRDPALTEAISQAARKVLQPSWGMELQRCVELAGYAVAYRPSLLRLVYGNALRAELQQGNLAEAVGDVFDEDIPLHTVSRWRQGIGSRALARLPGFIETTHRQAAGRIARLEQIPGVQVIRDAIPGAQGVWPVLMLRLRDEERRDKVLGELWGSGLGVSRMFIYALHDYAYLRPWLAAGIYPAGAYPNARSFAAQTLTISNSPWLDDEDFARICTVVRRYA